MDRERLIRQTLHICRREARRWNHLPIEQEDLAADAAVGLVRASHRFDPDRGVPFSAFALPYVRGAILDTIRARARRRSLRDGRFADIVSLDEPRYVGDSDQLRDLPDPRPGPHDIVESLDALRLVEEIPPKERFVLLRTQVDGATAAEVAEELGVSENRVYVLAHSGSRRLRRRAA